MVRLLLAIIVILLSCDTLPIFADEDKEVITAEDIEKEKPATLMELLKKRVGLGDSQGAITLRGGVGFRLTAFFVLFVPLW